MVLSCFYCKYLRSTVIFKLPVIYVGNQIIRSYMSFKQRESVLNSFIDIGERSYLKYFMVCFLNQLQIALQKNSLGG